MKKWPLFGHLSNFVIKWGLQLSGSVSMDLITQDPVCCDTANHCTFDIFPWKLIGSIEMSCTNDQYLVIWVTSLSTEDCNCQEVSPWICLHMITCVVRQQITVLFHILLWILFGFNEMIWPNDHFYVICVKTWSINFCKFHWVIPRICSHLITCVVTKQITVHYHIFPWNLIG